MIDILVFTCAKYAHLIPKHLTFFERVWTLPYSLTYIVAGTNMIQVPGRYNRQATRFITMHDNGMAANILDYLREQYRPFLLLMDDHMLFYASSDLLASAWDIIQHDDVGCVRLVPWPGPTQPYSVEGFGEIDKTQEYAISLQASFWKPATFEDLLNRSWSPWQIELEGSKRAASYPKQFIGCETCAVNYKDYMLRGKPRPEHAQWVMEHL